MRGRVAREIISIVRREGLKAGDHLGESHLAEQIGISRSPVQAAMRLLAEHGVLERSTNRGFFLTRDASEWTEVAARFSSTPDNPLYLRIAEARQAQAIQDEVSEAELMRQFNVARSTLRKVLSRISEEGWVEQRVGQGWCFLPMIDSPDAYEESYLFRQAIEPTGLLSPSFRVEPLALAELRREQERIAKDGYLSMTPIELFEANSRFHETLAEWSHNRFILQSVRRVNQLRRLVEYRQASQRAPRQNQASEHLEILQAIEAMDAVRAASLMKSHLDGARRGKSKDKTLFS